MSLIDRKEREKESLRQRILDTALELFNQEGYERTTVRKIAASLQYSPTTLYLYFENKRDIFFHLHETVFSMLYKRLSLAHREPDPLKRLARTCREYLRFAFAHPNYYHLMFIIHSPQEPMNNLSESNFGMKCLAHFQDCVARGLEHGVLRSGEVEAVTFMIWSFLHGMASLIIQKRPRMYTRARQMELMDQSLLHFLKCLEIPQACNPPLGRSS